MFRSHPANQVLRQDRGRARRAVGQPGPGPGAWPGARPGPRSTQARFLSSGADAAGQVTVILSGDLDLTAISPLSRYLAAICESAPRRLVLDMSRVGFMDCASARLIAGAGRCLPGGRVVLRRPGPAVLRMLRITGLAARCEMVDEMAG
jgi:anti-sigma B factor antagonist